MKMYNIMLWIALGTFAGFSHAEESLQDDLLENIPPSLNALHADWIFSGLITNENGQRYTYYFQMHREGKHFSAVATLMDGQSGKRLLHQESTVSMDATPTHAWHVGNAFLQFNSINNSWVFGVKTEDHKGFNFKVDTLKTGGERYQRVIQPGVELLIHQTGYLNGHIQVDAADTEQFVTGQRAWFRQIWSNSNLMTQAEYQGILCQFYDGSGFFAISSLQKQTPSNVMVGWQNAQGASVPMSSVVTTREIKKGVWRIRVPFPKTDVQFNEVIAQNTTNQTLLGGLTHAQQGFCMVSRDTIGDFTLQEHTVV